MVTEIKSIARFGLGQAADVNLPEGWKLIESPTDFLKAKDPAGAIYIIGTGPFRHKAFKVLSEDGDKVNITTDHSIDIRATS